MSRWPASDGIRLNSVTLNLFRRQLQFFVPIYVVDLKSGKSFVKNFPYPVLRNEYENFINFIIQRMMQNSLIKSLLSNREKLAHVNSISRALYSRNL